jgi:hypothetical protein
MSVRHRISPRSRSGRGVRARALPDEPDVEVELPARRPMLQALNEHHALAACEVIDVARRCATRR